MYAVSQLCPTFCGPLDYSPPLSTEFSRQEYWSGLPFPTPGDFPDPEIKPASPALDSFTAELLGKPREDQGSWRGYRVASGGCGTSELPPGWVGHPNLERSASFNFLS